MVRARAIRDPAVGVRSCSTARRKRELSGSEPSTTNNRMELLGVITALETLKEPCSVDLYSDSKYVVDGITKGWAKGWRARGWVKSDKKPAKIRNSGGVCSICWINTRCGSIGSRVTRIIHITTAVTNLPSASIRSINKSNTFFTKCEEGVSLSPSPYFHNFKSFARQRVK